MDPAVYVFVVLVVALAGCVMYWRLRDALPALGGWCMDAVNRFEEARRPAPIVMSRPAASLEPAPPVRTDTTAVRAPADTTLYDVLRLAAGLKKADGSWYWSANEMAAWSKHGRNETLAVVREVRGEQAIAVTQARLDKEYAGSAGLPYEPLAK